MSFIPDTIFSTTEAVSANFAAIIVGGSMLGATALHFDLLFIIVGRLIDYSFFF